MANPRYVAGCYDFDFVNTRSSMSSSLRTSASSPRVSHVYTQSAMRPLLIVASLSVCRPGREIKPDKVQYVYQSPYGGGGGGTPQSFTGHLMFAVFVLFFVNPIFGLMALALAGELQCCVYTEPNLRTHGARLRRCATLLCIYGTQHSDSWPRHGRCAAVLCIYGTQHSDSWPRHGR